MIITGMGIHSGMSGLDCSSHDPRVLVITLHAGSPLVLATYHPYTINGSEAII